MTETISVKEALLINAIGQETQNQRNLAENTGLSLGMTNILLKKLVTKGYVKVVQLNGRTLRYILTPRGFNEKLQRTHDYLQQSVRRIRHFKQALLEQLGSATVQPNQLYVYGGGEVFELTCEILSEAGIFYEVLDPDTIPLLGNQKSKDSSPPQRPMLLDCNVSSPELQNLAAQPWIELRHVADLMA